MDLALCPYPACDGPVTMSTSSIFLHSLLTILHLLLSHPAPSQLAKTFERYIITFGLKAAIDKLMSECSLCTAVKSFPWELESYTPQPVPRHPGSHFNIDVMRRAGQFVIVNGDKFSNFATSAIIKSESRDDLADAILAIVTPVRNSSMITVRTDRAAALQSLARRPDQRLTENGVTLILGESGNPNWNSSVDKIIAELEAVLRRICPSGGRIDAGTLARAVTVLNNKVRGQGLTASQMHFARDL